MELNVKMTGLNSSKTNVSATKKKVLTSANVMDENSFSNPEMVRLDVESFTYMTYSLLLILNLEQCCLLSQLFCSSFLKIVPQESLLVMPEGDLTFVLPPYSFSSFDLLKEAAYMKLPVSELTSIL